MELLSCLPRELGITMMTYSWNCMHVSAGYYDTNLLCRFLITYILNIHLLSVFHIVTVLIVFAPKQHTIKITKHLVTLLFDIRGLCLMNAVVFVQGTQPVKWIKKAY